MQNNSYKSNNLLINGPIIEIIITVPKSMSKEIEGHGFRVPIVHVSAVIDTGSTYSVIDTTIVDELNLVSTNEQITFTSIGPQKFPIYDVGIILSPDIFKAIPFQVSCIDLSNLTTENLSIKALIGRDVLSRCIFTYNGLENSYNLSF